MLFITGAGMIAGSFYLYRKTKVFIKNAIKTDGAVISQTYSTGSNNSSTYTPTIEFKTREGSSIEFDSHMGSRSAYSIGEIMEVLYLEDEPEKARVKRFLPLWGFPALFGIVGLFCCIAGYALITEGMK